MERTSLLDKLIVLKDLIFEDAFIVIVLLSFVIIGFLLLNIYRFNKDIATKSCFAMYFLMMFFMVVQYHEKFFGLLDYLINNIFFGLIFPNLVVYSATIVITSIIMLKTIFNKHMNKILRNVNMTVFCTLAFIMFLILNVVTEKNIDVYSELSIYTNTELYSLIQLNMIIFIVWIVALIIIKFITKNIKPVEEKEKPKVIKKEENKINKKDFVPPHDFTLEEYKLLLDMLEKNKKQQ